MALPAALVPLRHPAFRLLWIANLVANTGMWMQSTGAGWLMTSLAPSPVMVSLVQVASLLPAFLLALPAGALADIVDRRLFLLATQAWMAASALLLAILTAAGGLGPWGLIALTFALGAGTAVSSPAWQATTPELVPREDLSGAIVLNGIGFNLSRAIGPAIGGLVVAAAGPEATFALNALCFLVAIGAVIAWRREAPRRALPREHFLSALRAGLGYVRNSPPLRATTIRAAVFFGGLAAIWGLLPLVVRQGLGLGPEWFGLMLAAMGIGAVSGGFAMPHLRARLGPSGLVTAGCVGGGGALVLLGLAPHPAVALVAMTVFGLCWLAGASTLQAAAQLATPAWVRARVLGFYQVATFGALALGTGLGGWAGEAFGLSAALALFGVGTAAAGLGVRKLAMSAPPAPPPPATPPETPRPEPADPALAPLLARERHRVLETVRYAIRPADRPGFLAAMRQVREARLRSGARDWRLYEDIAHPDRWVEAWEVGSWSEHLREADRLTEADLATLARAAAFHAAEGPPEAARYLSVMPDMS